MRRRVFTAGAAALGLSAVLGACGSGSGGSGSTGSGSTSSAATGVSGATPAGTAAADAFPVTVASALGSATVPRAPQRVVTLGWGSNDAALALGVVPVGMSVQVTGAADGVSPWARERLGGATPATFQSDSGTIPYEQIAALRPDLVLAVYSGITAEQYATLSKIAPTVGYPDQPWSTAWPDQLATVGKALGRTAQAAALRQQVTDRVAQAASAHPEFAGLSAIFGSGTQPGSYNLYLPDDPRMQLLGQLGFTVSDAAATTFAGAGQASSFSTAVSLEQLPKLDTDVLVAWYLSESTRSSIEGQPVFADLAPVRDGAYVPITDPALLFATSAPNVLTIPWMLKTYVPLLAAAARRASGGAATAGASASPAASAGA